MRLNLATILAGLILGWAAAAQAASQADAPPAAPIFYCPTPGKAAPVVPVNPQHAGCPAGIAVAHHHRHGHAAAPAAVVASNDVSASQAFIYRYERAVHGLEPQAASQAWAEGNPPPPGPALAQREIPPPPCPHGCPGPDAWRHGGPPPMAERGPPPAPPGPPLAARGYAWNDGRSGYAYQESERERAGGWSYSEEDGRGQFARWGDPFVEPPGRWDGPPRPCPPSVPGSACAAGEAPPPFYRGAGRDAAGYLTWPGKTPAW